MNTRSEGLSLVWSASASRRKVGVWGMGSEASDLRAAIYPTIDRETQTPPATGWPGCWVILTPSSASTCCIEADLPGPVLRPGYLKR
jgi:hypothetical protein